jgi:solute:Na+ symporter, SSS family
MMAIAAANLFTRNVYLEFVNPEATSHQQTHVSKLASLVVKFGAVGFVLFVPTTFVINFQLAAGVWILQTLPAVFLGLLWRRLDARAVFAGWVVGTAIGTALLIKVGFATSSYSFGFGGHHSTLFIGVPALVANLAVAVVASVVMRRSREEQVAIPATGGIG